MNEDWRPPFFEGLDAWMKQDYITAERLFRAALGTAERTLPLEDRALGMVLSVTAACFQALRHDTEAEALRWRALAAREQSYGPHHLILTRELDALAQLCRAQGRGEEAEALESRSRDLWVRDQEATQPG